MPADPTVLVRGGTLVDAAGRREADVLVRGGIIAEVGPSIDPPRGATVLEAAGAAVLPGLVDLHTHLRQPGREDAETVESGSRAAALGGYTAVVAMPNTDPPMDSAPVVARVLELGRAAGLCDVLAAGAITVGRRGEHLAPMAELAELGVRLFTDDGTGVQSACVMRRAMIYARGLGVTLAQHCEDATLSEGGVMHEGACSSALGIPGIPASAEEVMVARDLVLAAETGATLHLLHLSTAGSVELVRRAKAAGLAVTAEATPHHLALLDAELAGFDPTFKVNPPLRTAADAAAVRAGLRDGTVDAVATDHAPHSPETKERSLDEAPPGMLGLETALGVTMGAFGDATLEEIVRWCSDAPARIAGVHVDQGGEHGGVLAPGRRAHLCVVDPTATWTVDADALASRSANSPYDGRTLTGRVRHTLYGGEPVVVEMEAQR